MNCSFENGNGCLGNVETAVDRQQNNSMSKTELKEKRN